MTVGVPWWRDAVVYQVYPRSFADANGDGLGDLTGITRRLDHLAELGVDAVWLSPFYRSPQRDAGYDVADYREVDPRFGTLADFDELSARARSLGLRLIVDLVPNHTSSDHEWFREALAAGPGSPERARYLFRPGRGPGGDEPPNNWESIFGGRAWTRVSDLPVEQRRGATDDEWYLHLFDSSQPDLDWTNPQVRAEFLDVLRFWLERGVDGFRIDVAHGLIKAEGLPDWGGTVVMAEGTQVADAGDAADAAVDSGPMFDQEGVHEIYREWHDFLTRLDPEAALIAEAWVQPMSRLARYVRPDEMQQAFNFAYLTAGWDADTVRSVIAASLVEIGAVGASPTWVLSNHDVIRHATRLALPGVGHGPSGLRASDPQPDAELGLRRARAATLQMLALPGSAYLYQGEELGLPDHTTLPDEFRQDPSFARTGGADPGRDGCRVPIPWVGDAPAAGFSFGADATPWLPQPGVYADLAVDRQTGHGGSTLEFYREALALRRDLELGRGELEWVEARSKDVLAFTRGDLLVATNYGDAPARIDVEPGARLVLTSIPMAPATCETGELALPPNSTAWLRDPGR